MQSIRLFIAATFALLAISCGKSDTATPATTPATSTVATTMPAGPRIVSMVPAATLNLVLMGATDQLVGVTKYDQLYLPRDKQDLPVVGDYEMLDYERLVKLKPTVLVIQKAEARIEPRLRETAAAQHFELVNVQLETIDDIWTTARKLGQAAGKESAAEMAILVAQAELKEVAATYAGKPRPRVLYVMTQGMVAGDKTIFGEMIELAGGKNAGAEVGRSYPEIGKEGVVKLSPDVLLIGAPDEPAQQANDPRLQAWLTLPIPAARSKRIYLITDGNSQMPSVDIGKNVRAMAQMIHAGEVAGTSQPREARP